MIEFIPTKTFHVHINLQNIIIHLNKRKKGENKPAGLRGIMTIWPRVHGNCHRSIWIYV